MERLSLIAHARMKSVATEVVNMMTGIRLKTDKQTSRMELIYLLWVFNVVNDDVHDEICTELSMRRIKGDDK